MELDTLAPTCEPGEQGVSSPSDQPRSTTLDGGVPVDAARRDPPADEHRPGARAEEETSSGSPGRGESDSPGPPVVAPAARDSGDGVPPSAAMPDDDSRLDSLPSTCPLVLHHPFPIAFGLSTEYPPSHAEVSDLESCLPQPDSPAGWALGRVAGLLRPSPPSPRRRPRPPPSSGLPL